MRRRLPSGSRTSSPASAPRRRRRRQRSAQALSSTGVWAVIVAAGRGERLGSVHPKAFARLGGRPLLAESLERLDASEWIEEIVVVAPAGWEETAILLAEE